MRNGNAAVLASRMQMQPLRRSVNTTLPISPAAIAGAFERFAGISSSPGMLCMFANTHVHQYCALKLQILHPVSSDPRARVPARQKTLRSGRHARLPSRPATTKRTRTGRPVRHVAANLAKIPPALHAAGSNAANPHVLLPRQRSEQRTLPLPKSSRLARVVQEPVDRGTNHAVNVIGMSHSAPNQRANNDVPPLHRAAKPRPAWKSPRWRNVITYI